jgi:hypothetical protein
MEEKDLMSFLRRERQWEKREKVVNRVRQKRYFSSLGWALLISATAWGLLWLKFH